MWAQHIRLEDAHLQLHMAMAQSQEAGEWLALHSPMAQSVVWESGLWVLVAVLALVVVVEVAVVVAVAAVAVAVSYARLGVLISEACACRSSGVALA